MPDPRDVFDEYVRRHDEGVRAGSFDAIQELFDADAELVFVGADLGPFEGRAAIGDAFERWPPAEPLQVMSVEEINDGSIRATLGPQITSDAHLVMDVEGGLINRLVIHLDVPS